MVAVNQISKLGSIIIYCAYGKNLLSSCVCSCYFKLTLLFSKNPTSVFSQYTSQLFSVTQNSIGLALLNSKAFRTRKLLIIVIKAFDCCYPYFRLGKLATGRSPPFLLHQSKIKLVLTKNGKSIKSL